MSVEKNPASTAVAVARRATGKYVRWFADRRTKTVSDIFVYPHTLFYPSAQKLEWATQKSFEIGRTQTPPPNEQWVRIANVANVNDAVEYDSAAPDVDLLAHRVIIGQRLANLTLAHFRSIESWSVAGKRTTDKSPAGQHILVLRSRLFTLKSGLTLRQFIDTKLSTDVSDLSVTKARLACVRAVLFQTMAAVAAAHYRSGFVHGNLTADNIHVYDVKLMGSSIQDKYWTYRLGGAAGEKVFEVPASDHQNMFVMIDGYEYGNIELTCEATGDNIFFGAAPFAKPTRDTRALGVSLMMPCVMALRDIAAAMRKMEAESPARMRDNADERDGIHALITHLQMFIGSLVDPVSLVNYLDATRATDIAPRNGTIGDSKLRASMVANYAKDGSVPSDVSATKRDAAYNKFIREKMSVVRTHMYKTTRRHLKDSVHDLLVELRAVAPTFETYASNIKVGERLQDIVLHLSGFVDTSDETARLASLLLGDIVTGRNRCRNGYAFATTADTDGGKLAIYDATPARMLRHPLFAAYEVVPGEGSENSAHPAVNVIAVTQMAYVALLPPVTDATKSAAFGCYACGSPATGVMLTDDGVATDFACCSEACAHGHGHGHGK